MNPPTARLLLVEDDATLGPLLKDFLSSRGFSVDLAANGVEALRFFKDGSYDLVILDVMIPALDGFTVGELFRERRPEVPIVFLTARSMHADLVRGFRAGADDYIRKPVNEDVLIARIEAVLRRASRGAGGESATHRSVYQLGRCRFFPEKKILHTPNGERQLTDREAALLSLLCEFRGEVLPRDYALQKLWGRNDFLARKSMDVFIGRLRRYLAAEPGVQIVNIHGSGFILEVPQKMG
ncbi:MAG: DNA-binding response regulator [Saprospiraceae bacterium]|nr:MAG: DNA-binding response regulator [Saprospiraceae bacterium]